MVDAKSIYRRVLNSLTETESIECVNNVPSAVILGACIIAEALRNSLDEVEVQK